MVGDVGALEHGYRSTAPWPPRARSLARRSNSIVNLDFGSAQGTRACRTAYAVRCGHGRVEVESPHTRLVVVVRPARPLGTSRATRFTVHGPRGKRAQEGGCTCDLGWEPVIWSFADVYWQICGSQTRAVTSPCLRGFSSASINVKHLSPSEQLSCTEQSAKQR